MNTPSPARFQPPTRSEMNAQYDYEDGLDAERNQQYEELSILMEQVFEKLNQAETQEANDLSKKLEHLQDSISACLAQAKMERN